MGREKLLFSRQPINVCYSRYLSVVSKFVWYRKVGNEEGGEKSVPMVKTSITQSNSISYNMLDA